MADVLSLFFVWQEGLGIAAAKSQERRRFWLFLGVAIHLGRLFVFEYLTFAA